MGMDLLAVKPSAEARRFEKDEAWWGCFANCTTNPYTPPPEGPLRAQQEHRAGAVVPGRYYIDTWARLLEALPAWGVNTDGFPVDNSGHVISGRACRRVADALNAHLVEYAALLAECPLSEFAARDDEYRNAAIEEAKSDIEGWRTCGGYAVW